MKNNDPKPMDDSIREDAAPATITNHARVCGAVKQLVTEVSALYPEVSVEYSNYDGRNTALDVTFDRTALGDEGPVLTSLLILIEGDGRVDEIITDEAGVLVSMRSSLRTQDSREPFGLSDALLVLSGADEGESDSLDGEDVPWDWENAAAFDATLKNFGGSL